MLGSTQDVPVTPLGMQIAYTIPVAFGSHGQVLELLLDTGSSVCQPLLNFSCSGPGSASRTACKASLASAHRATIDIRSPKVLSKGRNSNESR